MNYPDSVDDEQSALVSKAQGVHLVETETTVGEENDASPRTQNADGIGADNSDQSDNVKAPEPHEELSTSGAEDGPIGC